MRIVFPDFIDIPKETKQKLEELGVKSYDDVPWSEPELIERIRDAEIITANYVDITPAVIDSCNQLKYIIVPAVGYEWVDHVYAASKGIKVLNCPTHNAHAVAEHAIALIFATSKNIYKATQSLRGGEWSPKQLQGSEVRGKKIGVLGYGRIGKDIAEMAEALGMKVRFVNTQTSDDELEDILANSDIICACLPLTSATRNLVNEQRLKLLKEDVIFINVGRGATTDQAALYTMLQNNASARAGLDVFENEPLSGEPSEEIVKLANLPNVIATPHIAYNTHETATRLGQELISNLESCIANNPNNVVG